MSEGANVRTWHDGPPLPMHVVGDDNVDCGGEGGRPDPLPKTRYIFV